MTVKKPIDCTCTPELIDHSKTLGGVTSSLLETLNKTYMLLVKLAGPPCCDESEAVEKEDLCEIEVLQLQLNHCKACADKIQSLVSRIDQSI